MSLGDYSPAKIEGLFNISPSSFYDWFTNKKKWSDSYIHNKKTFTANTSTVFGNIVHYMAECYAKDEQVNWLEVKDYIDSFSDNSSVDNWYFDDKNLKHTHKVLLDFLKTRNKPDRVEFKTIIPTREGFSLGGTVDALHGSVITDYKTVSSISKTMKEYWKYQMTCYAICEIANGNNITDIEVIQIRRPDQVGKVSEKTGKIVGIKNCEILALREPLTDELIMEVKEYITTMMDTVVANRKYPELSELLFPDNPLDKR